MLDFDSQVEYCLHAEQQTQIDIRKVLQMALFENRGQYLQHSLELYILVFFSIIS